MASPSSWPDLVEPQTQVSFVSRLPNGFVLCGVGSRSKRLGFIMEFKQFAIGFYVEPITTAARLLTASRAFADMPLDDLRKNPDFYRAIVNGGFACCLLLVFVRSAATGQVASTFKDELIGRGVDANTLGPMLDLLSRKLEPGQRILLSMDGKTLTKVETDSTDPGAGAGAGAGAGTSSSGNGSSSTTTSSVGGACVFHSAELARAIRGIFFDERAVSSSARSSLIERIPAIFAYAQRKAAQHRQRKASALTEVSRSSVVSAVSMSAGGSTVLESEVSNANTATTLNSTSSPSASTSSSLAPTVSTSTTPATATAANGTAFGGRGRSRSRSREPESTRGASAASTSRPTIMTSDAAANAVTPRDFAPRPLNPPEVSIVPTVSTPSASTTLSSSPFVGSGYGSSGASPPSRPRSASASDAGNNATGIGNIGINGRNSNNYNNNNNNGTDANGTGKEGRGTSLGSRSRSNLDELNDDTDVDAGGVGAGYGYADGSVTDMDNVADDADDDDSVVNGGRYSTTSSIGVSGGVTTSRGVSGYVTPRPSSRAIGHLANTAPHSRGGLVSSRSFSHTMDHRSNQMLLPSSVQQRDMSPMAMMMMQQQQQQQPWEGALSRDNSYGSVASVAGMTYYGGSAGTNGSAVAAGTGARPRTTAPAASLLSRAVSLTIKTGYLHRHAFGVFGDKWRLRFFQLSGSILAYRLTPDHEIRGCLDLARCSLAMESTKRVVSSSESKLPGTSPASSAMNAAPKGPVLHDVFTITDRVSGCVFRLSAEPDTVKLWLRALQITIGAARQEAAALRTLAPYYAISTPFHALPTGSTQQRPAPSPSMGPNADFSIDGGRQALQHAELTETIAAAGAAAAAAATSQEETSLTSKGMSLSASFTSTSTSTAASPPASPVPTSIASTSSAPFSSAAPPSFWMRWFGPAPSAVEEASAVSVSSSRSRSTSGNTDEAGSASRLASPRRRRNRTDSASSIGASSASGSPSSSSLSTTSSSVSSSSSSSSASTRSVSGVQNDSQREVAWSIVLMVIQILVFYMFLLR